MKLIVDAEPVSVDLKMSVVQESLPVTETLLNDPILEPLESNSSDAENIPETSSEATEKEQLNNDILHNIEEEINELLADDEHNQSETGKLDEEATVDNEKAKADKTDDLDKDLTTSEEINENSEPNTNQSARAAELKVNGDDENYVKDVEKVSDEISTPEVQEAELEKVEENGKDLNGRNNTFVNTDSVKDEELTNKINDQDFADDFSETKSIEDNAESLGEEINKLIADDLDDKFETNDDSNKKEKAAEFMEVDVDNELEKITDAELTKTDSETIVNGIREEVEHMETSTDVINQTAEIENISVADNVKKNSEEIPSNDVDTDINMDKGPKTSNVLHEESLEDFINATDIREDPTLNDAELDNINEHSAPKIANCDKSDSPAGTDSIELVQEEPMNVDTSIEVTENNIDTTPKNAKARSPKSLTCDQYDNPAAIDSIKFVKEEPMNVDISNAVTEDNTDTGSKNASTEQVIPEKENTSSTEDVSQKKNEATDSTIQDVLDKGNAQSNVEVAKCANNMEKISDGEIETAAPAVIDAENRKETVIDEHTSSTQNMLDCPGQDKTIQDSPTQDTPSSPVQDKSSSPILDKPSSPTQDKLSCQAKLDIPVEDEPASSAQDNKSTTAVEDKLASPAQEPTSPGKDKTTEIQSRESKECVSLVDDDDNDDIMVIDEDSNYKCDKSTEGSMAETVSEETMEPSRRASIETKTISDNDDDSEKEALTAEPVEELEPIKVNKPSELDSKEKKEDKPLVPVNFLNSFKTKMSEMTRADLEEFCLLKIVEGVVDRSNLSDIKAKLKTMMQNVEEWRKKAMVLNKQNRDLQIVLRTVQEEQKKKSDEVITPLKITRSVGMQVLMTENKTDTVNRTRGQKRLSNQSSNTQPQKPPPKVMSQPTKILKSPIPVPRLVPAQTSSPTKPANTKSSPQVQNSTVSSNSGGGKPTTPNGIRTYTQTRAAEKRSFSVSIDLTDDEPPPAKQMATTGKGIQNPVRLVPSQQLLAPARTSIITNNNNSKNSNNPNLRQVYIPIGAPQGNIRPGQTIVFKNSANVRARQPAPGTIVRASQPSIRNTVPRGQNKHPAPLPQAYSQPQPPNWKALPPAPDLKISKIENGIVVSWKIDGYQEDTYEEIVSYQLFAYQETNAPASTFLWNKIGDIKALPLPMACTLTQFIAGYKYYFAVRAVDIRSRIGPFSLPGSILLLNK